MCCCCCCGRPLSARGREKDHGQGEGPDGINVHSLSSLSLLSVCLFLLLIRTPVHPKHAPAMPPSALWPLGARSIDSMTGEENGGRALQTTNTNKTSNSDFDDTHARCKATKRLKMEHYEIYNSKQSTESLHKLI